MLGLKLNHVSKRGYRGGGGGWGEICLFVCSLISRLEKFSILQKCMLNSLNRIHTWQVSPPLSCGSTCQIWMWYQAGNKRLVILKNNGTEQMVSNHHPRRQSSLSRINYLVTVWHVTCCSHTLRWRHNGRDSLTTVYSTVYSDADQRKHQSSASLAFVWGLHQGPE